MSKDCAQNKEYRIVQKFDGGKFGKWIVIS